MDDVIQITIEGTSASLVAAANQATNALGQLEQNATKTGGVLSSVFSGIGQGVGIAAGVASLNGLVGAFGAVGNAAIGLNSKLEQSQIGFTSMLGSAEKANAFLRDLQQFAIKTPFEFPELVTAAQRMLAFGFAAKDVQPLLTSVGSAASAMGSGASGVERITMALGQMKAATVVQLGELNQLTEAGVPAFEILAQAMGKTTGQVKQLVSQGKIASDVFITAFQEWSKANFGDMMEKQSHTFQGAMSTIHDAVSLTLAGAFRPLFDAISAGADTVAQFFSSTDFQTWASALQVGIQGAIGAIGGFLSVLAPVGEAISTAFGQFTSGEFAAGFSTIGAAIQAVLGQGLAAVQSFATEMFGAGANLIAELAGGIVDAGSSLLTNAVNAVADIIAGFLIGNSPPPQGPLSNITQGGANTIAAWGEGALGAVDAAVSPVVAAVAGNLDQLKDAGRGADQAIREIGRSIQDLENQSRDLKNASEDVKRTYDDQIKALDDQIKSIEKAADGTREREKLEMSLEEHMLRQAEVQAMGDPVLRAQLRTRLDALKAQQQERQNTEQLQDAERALSGSRKDQLKDQQDALALSRQEADLRARLKDAKTPEERSRIQAQLKELEVRKEINAEDAKDRQQAAERRMADAKAKQEQLQVQQQLDGMVDKEALARIKADEEALHARQEEVTLAEQRAKAEAALATGPLKDERDRLIAERDAALKPLQAQLEIISRQKEALTEQRQVQQDIKQEIVATMQALKDQVKAQADAAKAAVPPGVDKQAYEGDQVAAAAAERAKATGAKLAASIGAGFSEWIHANFAGLAVGAIGAVFGGALFGPLGAVAGAYLATAINTAVQERLSAAGFDITPLLTKIGDSWNTFWQALKGDWQPPTADEWVDPFVQKIGGFGVVLKQFGDELTPTFQRLGEVVRTAFSGDLTGAIDKLKISMQLTANEMAPTIKSWQDGLAQLATSLGSWLLSGATALDATLTKWFNDAVLAIKWAEIGVALGRSMVGSTQTGLDQAGAASEQLNTAALQAGLGALLQGVITGAWDQTLENWRTLAPGESYAAVFVEGLDRGGMVEALMAVDVRLKEEWDRHRAEEFAAFQAWDKQMLDEWNLWLSAQFTAFTTWDVQMMASWNTWLLSLFTAFQTWDVQMLAEFNLWLKTEFDAFTTWAGQMVTGFTTWMADLGKTISDGWNAIWARTGEALDAIWTLITQKAADIAGQFTNMVTEWTTAGTDMAAALVKAVGDGLAALAETVIGPIKSAIDQVKGLLNFGSGGGGSALGAGGGKAMQYKDLIEKVSREENVPANRLAALIDVENSGEKSVSPAGARGIMQVIPGQGYDLPGEDASDPETSIRQGARALKDKYNRTGSWDEAGAAYFGYGRDAGGMDTNTYRSRYLSASARYTPPTVNVPNIAAGLGDIKVSQAQWGASVGMTPAEAAAACGPYAAFIFAKATGRMPNPAEAEQLARASGWTEAGMGGTGNFMNLLGKEGVNAVRTQTSGMSDADITNLAANAGPLEAFSTPGHYFASTGFDPATQKFNVGATGTFAGGNEQMTVSEMEALMGPITDVISLAGQMGPAFTDASAQGAQAFDALVGSATTMADGTTIQVSRIAGPDMVATITDGTGQITAQYTTMTTGITDQTAALVPTVTAQFDLMGSATMGRVTELAGGILTTTSDMAGNTVATVTDMNGQVTSQFATLADGANVSMGDMRDGVSTIVTDMGGTIQTVVADAAGNTITTVTDMSGNVVSQFATMASQGSASLTSLADMSKTQFGAVATAAGLPIKPIDTLQGALDGIQPPDVGDIVSAFDDVAQAADDAAKAAEDAAKAIKGVGKVGGSKSGNKDNDPFAKGSKGGGFKAVGGSVFAGQAYMVGDGIGPEVFVPDTNGRIIPRISSIAPGSGALYMGQGGGQSSGTTITVNLHVEGSVMTEQELVETVRAGLIDMGRRNGIDILDSGN